MKIKSMQDFCDKAYYIRWNFYQINKYDEVNKRIFYKAKWKKSIYDLENLSYYEKNMIWDFLNGYCEIDRIEEYVCKRY